MRFNKFCFATVAVVSTLALPGLAQATSTYHDASGEAGFTYHPDHAPKGKTRAEVVAEVEAAQKNGTLALMQRGIFPAVKDGTRAKSRADVVAEVEAAQKDGTLPLMQRGIFPPAKSTEPAKTR